MSSQTLVAVVVGGLLTLASSLVLEAWRERRHRKQRTEEGKVEMRMAARLVVLDLISMLSMLEAAGKTARWWTRLQLPIGAWTSHSQVLSRDLPDITWRAVGSTFAGASSWNEIIREMQRYYWVMPHLNLHRYGLLPMRKELQRGAGESIQALLQIAIPTVDPDDPLYMMARRALAAQT